MADTPNKLQETPVTSNSETVASLTEVTSSSPTTSTAAFQPFQQLHEAVLAAVNSNGISHHSLFAAAAAVAAATNANPLPNQQIKSEMDVAKKESIRASNRERKKKWRIHNEERNKDNDLRCRVNKRAGKLFGAEDSPAKQAWVQDEFEKRRQKRMDKERRKMIVNNALSVPPEGGDAAMMVSHGQLPSFYPPLPQIDTATAAKLLDFPTDLQRQLLEQLNNSMLALTNGIQQTTNKVEEIKQEVMNDVNQASSSSPSTIVDIPLSTLEASSSNTTTTNNTATDSSHSGEEENKENKESNNNQDKEDNKPEYPMDTVLTLMQLNAGWKQ
ncbi:hypothetical protein K501DRAFT_287487 [Backusella circina FSU 941]|nr:hypothetical protein K501DRAFT_287487 [Backusella circina FSU 941]